MDGQTHRGSDGRDYMIVEDRLFRAGTVCPMCGKPAEARARLRRTDLVVDVRDPPLFYGEVFLHQVQDCDRFFDAPRRMPPPIER